MPVLSLACHLPHNTPQIPSRYNNELRTKQTKAINNSYIYIYISHVNVTQTVPDISPLMPMHQDPLLVNTFCATINSPPPPPPPPPPSAAYMRQWMGSASIKKMACGPFGAEWATSHYLNQWWVIVNCTLRNKLQWNFNQNTKFVIH